MMDGVDQSLVSIDVIALRFGNPEPGMLRFAVTPRQAEPYTGQLALPGVLLGAGERLQDAARRAVTTKLGIPDEKILVSGQLTVFDEPNRDPRGPTLSVTMWAVISSDEVPGSAEWVSWDNPGDLAFDHNRIVADTRPILAVSADSHITEHPDTYTAHIDRAFRDLSVFMFGFFSGVLAVAWVMS